MRIRFGTSNRVVSRLLQAIGPQGEVRRRGDVAERDKDVSPGHQPTKGAPGRLASRPRRGIETLLRLERRYEVRGATRLTQALRIAPSLARGLGARGRADHSRKAAGGCADARAGERGGRE